MSKVFLSYAGADADAYFEDFVRDLGGELRVALGAESAQRVLFRDVRNIEIGEPWSAELTATLASCDCFVSLFSPTYFRREMCGKEWALFHQRVNMHRPGRSFIVPVLWHVATAEQPFPDLARALQQRHEE